MLVPVKHYIPFASGGQLREIDNHYHLQIVAANTDELMQHQERAFRLQWKAAAENLRALASLGSRQDRTNALIEELNGRAHELLLATNTQTDVLREGFEELAEGLGQLNATAEDLLDATKFQTQVLEQGFATVARLMMEQHRTLLEITRVLRNPYETKAQELLKEAERALQNGMRASGRDRQEEFKDALRLLTEVLNNPIGSRDFVAWFQIGWLKWKDKQVLAEAAEAFYQAARLSGSERKPYYVSSLRHLAYIQYLQGQHQDAFATIEKAVKVAPEDHDVLYDAARYAAKTLRSKYALELLEKCIDLRPQTIVTMFSESDFLS
jgi:tetratricopeptide (TPR) repeat protein